MQPKNRIDATAGKSDSEKREGSDDPASSELATTWLPDERWQMLRHYNPRTGKCDLTEEQADEQERRQRVYDQAADEVLARRRQERLESWRSAPLEPAARLALGTKHPELAWLDLVDLLSVAIDEFYPEAWKIATEMGLGIDWAIAMDLSDIYLMFSELNPVVGINQFNYVNPAHDLSDVARKMPPLEALRGLLRILAVSDRPISRDQWIWFY